MAELQKSENEYKSFLGWYGTCGECTPKSIDDFKNDIYLVYEWNEEGYPRKWKSSLVETSMNSVTEFKCGRAYYIMIKKGTGSITIENLTLSMIPTNDDESSDYGRLVDVEKCEELSSDPVVPDDDDEEVGEDEDGGNEEDVGENEDEGNEEDAGEDNLDEEEVGEDEEDEGEENETSEAMVFELENSKIIGFKMRAKLKEDGYLKWTSDEGEIVTAETDTEELVVDGDVLTYIKANLELIKYFELKTLKNMSFDKESCTLIENEKVFRYPVLTEKVEKGVRQRYVASNITSLYSDFLDDETEDVDAKFNDFIGEDGFDITQIINKDGDDSKMVEKEVPVFKRVRDKFTMLVESIDMEEGTDEEESEVKLDRAMTRIRNSRKKEGENRKLFSENVIKDLIVEDDNTKKTNFKESMDLMFAELESTTDLSPSVFMDSLRNEIKKDNSIENKKMSNIKNIDETKRGQLVGGRKKLARKRECGFEAVEEHIGPSFYIPPTIPITGTVRGNVSDWNQPKYYESNNIIPSGELTNYSNGETFDAWCAPTSASIQLEHLINYGGLKKPTNINDGFDSSNDVNPNMQTIGWDSARGWGNHLLDGPSLRGIPGDELSVPKCEVSDFGWYMDTNGCGQYKFNQSNPTKGTTIDMIWKGLNEFYAHAGWHKLVGRVDHIVPSTIKEGAYPYLYDKSSGANSDLGGTFQAIISEINKNRTILASFSSWNLVERDDSTSSLNMGSAEEEITYYDMGEGNPVIAELGEELIVNIDNVGASLGHTVVVFGYIQAGSRQDTSNGANDWLLVRDNYEATARTIAIPYQSAFNSLISTFYVDPNKGVFKQCTTNTTTINVSNPNQSSEPYYTFSTEEGEVININEYVFERDMEYHFKRTDSGHSFNIRTEPSLDATDDTWNPLVEWIEGKHITENGVIKITIPKEYDGQLFFQCSAHPNMKGELNIASTDDFMACTKDVKQCGEEDFVNRDPLDGCKFPPCGNFDMKEFKANHEMWMDARINDYTFVLTNTIGNVTPLKIFVERGLIVKIEKDGEDVTRDPEMKVYTIKQLFNLVNRHYHSDDRPHTINIEYNQDNHFISMITMDFEEDSVNQQVGYTITEFDSMIVIEPIQEENSDE